MTRTPLLLKNTEQGTNTPHLPNRIYNPMLKNIAIAATSLAFSAVQAGILRSSTLRGPVRGHESGSPLIPACFDSIDFGCAVDTKASKALGCAMSQEACYSVNASVGQQGTCAQVTDGTTGGEFECGPRFTIKSTPADIYCGQTPCLTNSDSTETEKCCDTNPTCDDIDGNGEAFSSCPTGSTIKSNLTGICKTANCRAADCCIQVCVNCLSARLVKPTQCSCTNLDEKRWVDRQLKGWNGCFVDVRDSTQAKECLGSSWTLIIGDSTMRGMVFGLLKLLRGENMEHPNSIAWLGAKSSMGSSGIDNEWLDMVFDTAAGKVIHIKSGAKGSVLPEYLYNDYKRSQSSFRITYVFARSIPGMCTSLRKEEETPVVFVCLCLFVLHIYYKQ